MYGKGLIGVKVGSKLFEGEEGVNKAFVAKLCQQMAELIAQDLRVFVVSSGAAVSDQTAGRSKNLRASIGWRRLCELYGVYLDGLGIEAAPILVTDVDLDGKVLYKTLNEAFADPKPIVPILNANDPVDDLELRQLEICADNDRLFKRVCLKIGAVRLAVIGFDQPGIWHPKGHLVRDVRPPDLPTVLDYARDSDKRGGHERMRTKISALGKLAAAGIPGRLVLGRERNFLLRAVLGEVGFGTTFSCR